MEFLTNISEKIKLVFEKKTKLVVFALFSFGILFIGFSTLITDTIDEINLLRNIFLNLGITSIVTSFAYLILTFSHEEVERHIKEGIKELDKKIMTTLHTAPFIQDAKDCGIIRIYESRNKNKAEILENFFSDVEIMPNKETVTIMAISLRNFLVFGDEREGFVTKLRDIMLSKQISVRLLLLDPMCSNARDRAIMEEPCAVKDRGYTATALYKESKQVIEFLMDPPERIVKAEDKERLGKLLRVRFYPQEPTTFIMHTKKYTFVEQYHRGGNAQLGEEFNIAGHCCAEFSPVLLLDNDMRFAKFLKSHVDNIWDSAAVSESKLTEQFFKKFSDFDKNLTAYEKAIREPGLSDIDKSLIDNYYYFLNRRSVQARGGYTEKRKNQYTSSKPFGQTTILH